MPENVAATSVPFSPLRRFWRLVATERKDIINVYVFAILAGLISLSLPLGIQAIFNYVSQGQVSSSWVVLVVVVILGVMANGILHIMQMSVAERLQQRIFTNSALEFAYRIPRLRMDQLRQQFAPELVNRFFDTLTIQKGLAKILLDFSASSLQILFGLILLSFYHPFFILFSLVLLGILLLIIRLSGPKGLQTSLQESKYKYKVVFWLEEMARSMETFKLSGPTQLPLEKTDEMLGKYLAARKGHFRILLTKYGAILVSKVLIISALLIIGSLLVYSNEVNIGQFVAMEIVVILLLSAVEKLIGSMDTIYDVLTALEKIAAVTDLELERHDGHEVPSNEGKAGFKLDIKDLSLQFPDEPKPILNQLNLHLEPGQHAQVLCHDDLFITHFFRMLSGFYDGYQGILSINGLSLRDISLEDLRLKTGGFSDSKEIFEGSLLENIVMGNKSIPMERVIAISKALELNDFIQQLPDGWSTLQNTGGQNLPDVIRRKLILARTLAAHPDLLLLNKPFEGMEAKAIEQFFGYLQNHIPATTVILSGKSEAAQAWMKLRVKVENHSFITTKA